MPMSHDVVLARGKIALFPDRCLRCDSKAGLTFKCFLTSPSGWAPWVLLDTRRWFSATAPVCGDCASRVVWERRVRFLAFLLAIVLAVLIVGPFFRNHQSEIPFWKAARLLAAIVLLIPLFLAHLWWPLSFDISVAGDEASYEFANASYAKEFAALNGVSVD
jgi:hypothetical protein